LSNISSDKFGFIDAELDRRRKEHRFRQLKPVFPLTAVDIRTGGRELINFCSNDYLGLSKHPMLRERAARYLDAYGAGATASRLVCGNFDIFDHLEAKLARVKQSEAALIFNSGFQANITVIPALADRQSLILSDRYNHNSIIQGARLSRATVRVYPHNDLAALERMLAAGSEEGFSRILVITESVFSMDGDISDIAGVRALTDRFNAILIVDDAHAAGVFGPGGMGLACGKTADVTIGTFSKGFGAFGACVTCSGRVRDYLVNCCPGFIYTTGLPPPVIGAIDAALDLIPLMDEERLRLWRHADRLRNELKAAGFDTGLSSAQIIPVIIGDPLQTLSLSSWLADRGILAMAIRPPTVPDGGSRIRISLSADHTEAHITRISAALTQWRSANSSG